MTTDIEMTDVNKSTDDKKESESKEIVVEKLSPTEQLASDIIKNVGIIDKAVYAKELRLLARALRNTGNIRKRLTIDVLSKAIICYTPESYKPRKAILSALQSVPVKSKTAAMEIDQKADDSNVKGTSTTYYDQLSTPAPSSIPEVSAFLHLLAILALLDANCPQPALSLSTSLVTSLGAYNRRSMDELNARAFFYFARATELTGNVSRIRSTLLSAYRTATLHHDAASQAVLLNLLLRNYISYNLYDQADKLLSRTIFPETRSNNQLARYLYYTGRVKAIQLDYSEALGKLQQALRKAPQSTALGFRISAQKFMIIVHLLTGEIPARDIFRQPQMQRALRSYLSLTQAVRIGDMQKFRHVLETASEEFEADQTKSLIMRLRHNVIKTGLRMLSSSYSRIKLDEICKRLHLDSPQNAEGVVAKAIHDRVIDATIDHDGQFVRSNETIDLYSTTEPTDAYHKRVSFCLNVHNDAVRAMRFPDKKEDEETPEQRRERLKEQEELAKTLAEEDDDDFEP